VREILKLAEKNEKLRKIRNQKITHFSYSYHVSSLRIHKCDLRTVLARFLYMTRSFNCICRPSRLLGCQKDERGMMSKIWKNLYSQNLRFKGSYCAFTVILFFFFVSRHSFSKIPEKTGGQNQLLCMWGQEQLIS
jgi:hypothetical protein